MPFFISNPVRIEANHFDTTSFDRMQALVKWMTDAGTKAWHNGNDIYIETLEGRMRANLFDWIILGTRGEFYPCKPDVFAVKYHAETTGNGEV